MPLSRKLITAGAVVFAVVVALLFAASRHEEISAVTWRTNDLTGEAYYAVLLSNTTERAMAYAAQSEISLNGRDWETASRDGLGGELKPHTGDSRPIMILVQPHYQRLAVHSWELSPPNGPLSRARMWFRARTDRPLYDTSYLKLPKQ